MGELSHGEQSHGQKSVHVFERSTPVAPQSNSSCLDIFHCRETTTGSVNLAQHLYQNCLQIYIFWKDPVVPLELESIVSFSSINVLTH